MARRPAHPPTREPEGEAAATAAPASPTPLGRALDARTVLALQRTAGNAAVGSLLQRAVSTSGGEWDTDTYELKKDDNGRGAAPPSQNWRGLDIVLKFKPNATVDAELIGLSQSVQGVVGGALKLTPGAAARPISGTDAKPIDTGMGETDEGTAIDQSATSNNPIYAVENDSSTKLEDPVDAYFGENGYRYTDATKALKEKSPWLMDKPRRSGADKNSRHIFETTALAIKGAQTGGYYGSVRWGWRTDAAGNFTKIDLVKVSDGVPSSTFMKAGEVWNASKTPGGKDTVDLPLVDVKVTAAAVTLKPPVPMLDVALPPGTRLQVITDLVGPMLAGTVKVVDGPHTGVTGEVDAAEWSNIADERA